MIFENVPVLLTISQKFPVEPETAPEVERVDVETSSVRRPPVSVSPLPRVTVLTSPDPLRPRRDVGVPVPLVIVIELVEREADDILPDTLRFAPIFALPPIFASH